MIKKKCPKCGQIKNVSEFYKANKKRDGYFYYCKACCKKYYSASTETRKKWYQKNKEKRKEYNRKWYFKNRDRVNRERREKEKEMRLWFENIKSKLKCEECGESHIACLVFHHINPKEKDFRLASASCRSKKNVLKEIKKCKVLCANCHNKLHYLLRTGVAE